MLPAPGRFSTTNCWPSVLASRGEIKRASTSAGEAAPTPTMILTGRKGYCCARVGNTIANSNSTATSQLPATSNTALSMVPRGLAFFCAGTIVRRTKRIDKPGEGGRPPISELPETKKGRRKPALLSKFSDQPFVTTGGGALPLPTPTQPDTLTATRVASSANRSFFIAIPYVAAPG